MILEENRDYRREEIAAWFEVSPKTFSNTKEAKLEELRDYADFDIKCTSKGNFKAVHINQVYCDTYYKTYRADFLKWLKEDDQWAKTGDNGRSETRVVTNYYFKVKGMENDMPHYIWEDDCGMSYDGKRKITERKLVKNPECKLWHYLHGITKKYYKALGYIDSEHVYPMSTGEENPTYLHNRTAEDEQKKKEICAKYYGDTDIIEEMEVYDTLHADERPEAIIAQLKQTKAMLKFSDEEKRKKCRKELMEAGVWYSSGYEKKIKREI